jgi:hypothetical protein
MNAKLGALTGKSKHAQYQFPLTATVKINHVLKNVIPTNATILFIAFF